MRELNDRILNDLRGKGLSEIIEKRKTDNAFCFYLHSFYNFYLCAEASGMEKMLMDGLEKTSEIMMRISGEGN